MFEINCCRENLGATYLEIILNLEITGIIITFHFLVVHCKLMIIIRALICILFLFFVGGRFRACAAFTAHVRTKNRSQGMRMVVYFFFALVSSKHAPEYGQHSFMPRALVRVQATNLLEFGPKSSKILVRFARR